MRRCYPSFLFFLLAFLCVTPPVLPRRWPLLPFFFSDALPSRFSRHFLPFHLFSVAYFALSAVAMQAASPTRFSPRLKRVQRFFFFFEERVSDCAVLRVGTTIEVLNNNKEEQVRACNCLKEKSRGTLKGKGEM